MDIADVIKSRVTMTEAGCWEFDSVNIHGYGHVTIHSIYYRVHRLSWEINVGPIPKGMWVLHKCDNRACCNPDHLFLGTPQDNVDDMRAKNRDSYGHNKGSNNGQAVLCEDDVVQIRKLLASTNYTQDRIGRMFGVTRGAIKSIKYGVTWSHLPEEN